jgi:hypothetical protein
MSRSSLKFLAVLLGVLIVAVLFAGLDNLPREVRAQISGERSALAAAQSQLQSQQAEVTRDLQGDPALFAAVPESAQWPATLSKAQASMGQASHDMDELNRLYKANRRQDQQRAETLLAEERSLRRSATGDAAGIEKQAAHWVDWKQHLPQSVAQMQQDYQTVHALDLGPAAATVQKAEADWPQKKPDLDARLAAMRQMQTQSDSAWQSSAEARKAALAGDYAHVNLQALAGAADTLHTDATDLPAKVTEVNALTGQLYNSWDKLLVDMETHGHGSSESYDQKIRTVTTHYADASEKNGATASDDHWNEVPRATFEAQKNDLGMVLEHKPAGVYDYEAGHTPEPPGFAYMAPPAQGSNQYGYWDHRSDGTSFWVFYGQYALMRDLLFNHSYRPPQPYDYDGYYNARRSGQTYYGKEYGTGGTFTQDRYSGSSYAKSGGFKDSRFASKPGGYRDSRFASPMAREPNADHSPHKFGSGSHGEEPHFTPRSYRPTPRPSMPRSMPRSFGRRR